MALSTLVASGGLAAVQGGMAHATEPGTDGVLTATVTGATTIVAHGDGTSQTSLSNAVAVAWSSDGSRIAFTSSDGKMYTADPDGGNRDLVNAPNLGGGPTWFDSNTKLVYTAQLPGTTVTQLYVAPVVEGQFVPGPLFGSNTGFCDANPKAVGNLIVFGRTSCPGVTPAVQQIWIYDKTTGTAHMVLDNASGGDISPDGTKLVFSRSASTSAPFSPQDLYEANIDGSNVTPLTTDGSTANVAHLEPAWSPSGTSIAFYDGGNNIETLNVGSGVETLWSTVRGTFTGSPAWQPVNAAAPKAPGPAPRPVLKATVGGQDASGAGDDVTLDATGSIGDGLTYTFDFGDGGTATPQSSPTLTTAEFEGTYKVTVTATDKYGRTSVSPAQWVTVGDGYHPVSPTRLLDTRSGLGAPQGKTTKVTLALPDSVVNNGNGLLTAVVLNVTVTDTTSGGNVKVYPHGLPVADTPTTSNLNFTPGLTVANLVTVPVVDGSVQMDVAGAPLSLVADISGYYTQGSSGAGFAPLTPTRLMDTRNGTGGVGGRVAGYGKVSLPVPATVSADATAVVLNVTAVNTAASGDLDVYPDVPGQATPVISNLNFGPGAIVPNLVIVPISADRKIDFYVHSPGSADLLADIQGYLSPTATSRFVPWIPTRLFDTRLGQAGGTLKSGYQIVAPLGQGLQVPSSALTAGLYNVTVTQPAGPGHITVYPDGLSQPPTVSNLNYTTGQTVPNAVLAPMTNGVQDFYNLGASTQLIVDFFGYFATPVATDAPPSISSRATTNGAATAGAHSTVADISFPKNAESARRVETSTHGIF